MIGRRFVSEERLSSRMIHFHRQEGGGGGGAIGGGGGREEEEDENIWHI